MEAITPTVSTGTLRRTRPDYWDSEREKLVAALIQRLAGGKEAIALRELLSHDLPEILKVVLRNHAKNVVRKERPFVLQSQRQYELDDPDIRRELRQLRDMFCERMIFDFAELKPVLSFGVRLQFDLIVKPRRFLEKLLYHHDVERTRGDIGVILVGFEDQRPFLVALLERLSNYPDSSVTKEAFNALCRQIERQVYRGNSAAPLLQDFDAYQNYRCALLGNGTTEASHANQMILAMLYERNLTELAESLLPEFTQQEFWMMHEIEKLVRRHWNRTDWTAQPASTDGLELSSEIDFGEFLDQAADEMESQLVGTAVRELRASEAVAVSLKESDHSGAADRQKGDALVDEMNSPPPAARQKEVSRQPFIRFDEEEPVIYRSKLEQQPPGPFPALTQLIDEKNRKLFVRKIFERDPDAYAEFIQRLEVVQTWKEAKQLLDQELNRRRINPYSKEVIRLSDLIFGRYFSKRT
ncbi:MAG: hypothetical protein ACREOO_24050 [bacterium]